MHSLVQKQRIARLSHRPRLSAEHCGVCLPRPVNRATCGLGAESGVSVLRQKSCVAPVSESTGPRNSKEKFVHSEWEAPGVPTASFSQGLMKNASAVCRVYFLYNKDNLDLFITCCRRCWLFSRRFPVSARDGPRFITLLLRVFRRSSSGALNVFRGFSYREIITVILSEMRKVRYE